MVRLFYYPGNANLAPHMVLEEIGAPYELVLVDRTKDAQKSVDYLKLNPGGVIPTLVDGDQVVTETAAICLHLCDRHPDAGLAPPLGSPERTRLYTWLTYLTNTVQAELLIYFYPERWTDDAAAAAQVKAHAEQRIGRMLDIIEASLASGGPWLLGQRYSAADPYLLMLGRWTRSFARPARNLPHLGGHLSRMLERPAVQRAFAQEGLKAPLV